MTRIFVFGPDRHRNSFICYTKAVSFQGINKVFWHKLARREESIYVTVTPPHSPTVFYKTVYCHERYYIAMLVYWLDLRLFETLHCYVSGKVKKNTKILTCSFGSQLWFKPVTSKIWVQHVTFMWKRSLRSENLLIFEKLFWTIILIVC
jgi:hypothetical protein